jgi:hypothetical protein
MSNTKQPDPMSLRDYLEGIQESVVQKGLISFIKSSYLSLSKVISHVTRLLYYIDSMPGEEDERLLEQLLMEGSVYDLMKTFPTY